MNSNASKKATLIHEQIWTKCKPQNKAVNSFMDSIKAIFVVVLLAIVLIFSSTNEALANVFTCKQEDCTNYIATTDVEFNLKSTGSGKPTVRQALSASDEASIINGFNNLALTDLGIKKFWHKGGSLGFDSTFDHLTVEVYKDNTYKKTCHVYSFQTSLDGPYKTTCVKPT